MKKTNTLQQLGISEGAEKVYMMLIEHGASLLTDISKKTRQFRADTYRYVKELLDIPLINQVQLGKRKKYTAFSPENIYTLLKKKEAAVTEGVTDMLKLFDVQQHTFQTETFAGKEGLVSIFSTLVEKSKRKSILCRIESPKDYKIFKKYYSKTYYKRSGSRSGGDIEKYVITNPHTKTNRQRSLNRSAKAIPSKFSPFNFDYTTVIIEDKVAFIDYENEKAVLIRDPRFAEYMRSIFFMLYESLK